MASTNKFLLKYGNGATPLTLWDAMDAGGRLSDHGTIKLVLDDENGREIEFFNSQRPDETRSEIIKKYGAYGVIEILHKYTCSVARIAKVQ